MKDKITHHKIGLISEEIAKKFLQLKGYKIIAQRIKYRCGEIDILACKNQNYYIIEVKKRDTSIDAISSISSKSMKRSVNTFFVYAQENNLIYDQIYFKGIILNNFFVPKLIDIDTFDFDPMQQ